MEINEVLQDIESEYSDVFFDEKHSLLIIRKQFVLQVVVSSNPTIIDLAHRALNINENDIYNIDTIKEEIDKYIKLIDEITIKAKSTSMAMPLKEQDVLLMEKYAKALNMSLEELIQKAVEDAFVELENDAKTYLDHLIA